MPKIWEIESKIKISKLWGYFSQQREKIFEFRKRRLNPHMQGSKICEKEQNLKFGLEIVTCSSHWPQLQYFPISTTLFSIFPFFDLFLPPFYPFLAFWSTFFWQIFFFIFFVFFVMLCEIFTLVVFFYLIFHFWPVLWFFQIGPLGPTLTHSPGAKNQNYGKQKIYP